MRKPVNIFVEFYICSKTLLIYFCSKILAGKTVGGVTITPAPAQPRILPTATAAANIGFGISISRTTKIPSSTTISAMSSAVGAGSGFAARSGGLGYAAVSSPVSTPAPSILNNVSPAQKSKVISWVKRNSWAIYFLATFCFKFWSTQCHIFAKPSSFRELKRALMN